jgi:hypothetical protein
VSEANKKPQKKRRHFLKRGDYCVASYRDFGSPSRAASHDRAVVKM